MEVFLVSVLLALCCSSLCRGALLAPPPTNSTSAADLQLGFYSRTCPQAEDIVRAQVQKRFLIDKTITPALLRMLFHDSFVRGADASILLDSKPGHEAEKEALPNLTIRGFDLINEVKEALELACPGVVSCADIIVLAVRDSVALAGGPKYGVPTGRLDGKVSIKEEALNLPSPAFPVEQSQESFRQKGLDLEDMVALLGAHTVGVALCGFFNDRLFNFHGTGAADPTMNPQLVTRLSGVCPNPFFTESNADPPIDLDQSTVALFDSAYYSQIIAGNGILQIDQEITADPSTAGLVLSFTSTAAFFPAFVRSIIKMGNIEVKTGANPLGEVRRQCNVSNSGAAVRTPAKPAPGGNVSGPPPVSKPAPAAPVTKPAPAAPVTKPSPAGHVSKPPPVSKPAPAAPVSKPPPKTKPAPAVPVTKPAPAAPVSSKPPPNTKPGPAAPVTKPAPAGHVSKSPRVTKPPPAGHVSKPPQTPIPKPAPGGHVTKPPTTPVTKPAPPGHVSKPAPPPGHVSKGGAPLTPATKPAPPVHGSKPPVRKPAPAGPVKQGPPTAPPGSRHVTKPVPPIGKGGLPTTPVGARAPPRHVSKPAPPGTPAATGHVSKQPAPSGHVSKQLPHTPVAKPAPPGHVSSSTPHTPAAKPAPSVHVSTPPVAPPHHVSTPPVAPPHQGSTPASHAAVSHVSAL